MLGNQCGHPLMGLFLVGGGGANYTRILIYFFSFKELRAELSDLFFHDDLQRKFDIDYHINLS